MKTIIKTFLSLAFCLLVGSCNTDFLDVNPPERMSETVVWSDPVLVEAYVNEIYRGLNHGIRELMIGSFTDESQFIHNYGSTQIVQSNITPSDIGSWTRGDVDEFRWTELYKKIRQINMVLENIDKVPFTNEAMKTRLKGEVHFLNAFFYMNLVRLHGGVPLVKRTFKLVDDFAVPRNTLEECIKYIVDQSDLAASLLPVSHSGANLGRATKGAALSIKSRMLLYAASDLYNNTSWAGGYAKPELISMSASVSRTVRWQAAKDAAKAVIDLGIYQLQDTDSPVKDYTDVFLTKNSREAIFSRYFLKSRGWEESALPGLANGPNGYHNWGGNTPVQELVDDYEMADGTKFSWTTPAHASQPYANRDPRFYASILYDQAPWRPRPSDAVAIDPVGKIIIRTVQTASGPVYGLDTRKGPIEDWNGGYSGYYMRKFIDPNVVHEFAAAGGNQEAPWHYFRLAEIYLNYAEACLGLTQETEAKTYMNMLRQRAGMPAITEIGQALVDRYRNERRVELAFEQHRYFDVRRWMIAPQALGRNVNGIVINQPLTGSVTYERLKLQDRAWNNKMYFLPILQDEMNKNTVLVQNPLY
jgi:starch-binding outer membrane protein, SusD/RagB family